jgi:hypothetical protein
MTFYNGADLSGDRQGLPDSVWSRVKLPYCFVVALLEYLKRGTQGSYIHISLLTVISYRWQSDLTVSLLQIHDSRRLGKE